MTPQQQKLLSLIAEAPICPSYEELLHSMGVKSKSRIFSIVAALKKQGKLIGGINAVRALEVVQDKQSEQLAIRNNIIDEENHEYKKENTRLRKLVRKLGG